MTAAEVVASVACPGCGQPVGTACRKGGGVCVQRKGRAEMLTAWASPRKMSGDLRLAREKWRQGRYR